MFRPLEIIKSKVCTYCAWALLFVTVLRKASSLLLLSIKSMNCKEWTVYADEGHLFNANNLLKLFSALLTRGTRLLMNTSAFNKVTVFNSWVKSGFKTSDCCLHIIWLIFHGTPTSFLSSTYCLKMHGCFGHQLEINLFVHLQYCMATPLTSCIWKLTLPFNPSMHKGQYSGPKSILFIMHGFLDTLTYWPTGCLLISFLLSCCFYNQQKQLQSSILAVTALLLMRLIVFLWLFLTLQRNTIHLYQFINSIADLETAPAPLSLTKNKQLFTENESSFKYNYNVITQLSSCFLSFVIHHLILHYRVKASESPPPMLKSGSNLSLNDLPR